jgi:hypothetical protein
MNRKSFIFPVIFLFASLLFSCNEATEDLTQNTNPEIEYKELTPEEVVLKSQLAEAAKIVAEIASDQEVLDEIIATIQVQPRIMEDRVKFSDLMNPKQEFKSGSLEFKTGKFARAFKSKLSGSGLKSASNLIESLSEQGIEVYIPYPIEDYPEGTEVVVTSHPIDNIIENTGFFISDGKEVMATEELAKRNPVVIITTPLYSDDKLQKMQDNRDKMDQLIASFNKNNLKSANVLDPMANWYNESKSNRFGIYIPKIYCTNDHVTGLFGVGDMYIIGGTISFDTSTKIVFGGTDVSGFGFALPRKYEGYAQNGWDKGWFDCNVFLFEDWNPAITKNTISIFIDTPNTSTTASGTLSASWLQKATSTGMELSKSLGVTASCSTTITTRDFVYGTKPWLRERYKTDYNSIGEVWGEAGERTKYVEGVGVMRPAILFSTELKYVTYCSIW